MKRLSMLLIAVGGLMSACVAYEVPYREPGVYRGDREHDHDRHGASNRGDRDRDGVPDRADRDRDGDGVANRNDRRPDDPRRY